jgi:archaellum component FlaG (FlaF/FlaG flagellin family)
MVVASTEGSGLVLWNRLGSADEVLNSEVGPNGSLNAGQFVDSPFGKGIELTMQQQMGVTFPPQIVPGPDGCIEFWAKLTGFSGTIRQPGGSWPGLIAACDQAGAQHFLLTYCCNDGASNGGIIARVAGLGCAGTGVYGSWTYESALKTNTVNAWHHYALVWASQGVPGVDNGLRKAAVYVDGKLNSGYWGGGTGSQLAVPTNGLFGLLSHQGTPSGSVAFDNIKIWSYAKTNFSDRMDESSAVLFLLEVGTNGNGTVTSVANLYSEGTNILVTATAASGWDFAGWTGDTVGCLIDGSTITAAMTQNRHISANFVRVVGSGLVLWNRLGSADEVLNSEVGPNGSLNAGQFVDSPFGKGIELTMQQQMGVTFPPQIVPGPDGCIEFWAKLTGFSGTIRQPGGSWPGLIAACDQAGAQHFLLTYCCNDGASNGGIIARVAGLGCAGTGVYGSWTYESALKTNTVNAWHHYALVWASQGVPGVDNGLRKAAVYVDGKLNSGYWGGGTGSQLAVPTNGLFGLLSHQGTPSGSVVFDNIKIWSYAKTDFSDRLIEGVNSLLLRVATNGNGTVAGVTDWHAEGASVNLTAAAASGWNFAGWTGDTAGCVINGSTITVEMTQARSITASFVRSVYTVTFNPQGGEVSPTSKTVTFDTPYGDLPSPMRGGYRFEGWWTGTGVTGAQATSLTTVTRAEDHALYARWTPQTYVVTLNPNGGTGGSSSVNATFDAPMPAASAPTMNGWAFNGYYDQPEAGNQYYSATMTSGTNWTHAGTFTLYAHWVACGTIRFQKTAYGVSENNELGLAALKVERVSGSYGPASVTFEIITDTATPGADYSATPYTLVWNAGQTGTRNLTVDIFDDSLVEGNESFRVRLINATGALLGEPSEALVTIVDNEAAESRIIRIEGGDQSGTMDFGSVATNSSSTKTLYVWNDGNQPFSITNVTVAAGFSVNQTAFTVEAGSMVSLNVTFSPALLQFYTGMLTVWATNTTGQSILSLAGTGIEPPPAVGMRKITGLSAIISIEVPTNATVLAVEDTLAPGLFPVSISDKGSWDSVNRKVKWFFDKKPDLRDRALQYTVNGLGSVTGGIVNFGSANHPISGDTEFVTGGDPGVLHPADANGDWKVTIEEVASHITRWNQGLEDVKTPYAIRGITLYLCGESYGYDSNVPPGAKRWIPAVTPASAPMTFASPKSSAPEMSASVAGAVRQVYGTNVTITVTPESGTLAYGLEEAVPECLSVSGISAGGVWDSNNRKIKWSFDDGTPRSLSYAVAGPEGTNVTVTGLVSFDGSEDPVQGPPEILTPFSFGTWASRKGLSSSNMATLFNTVSGTSGLAYGFEYAFGTNIQSAAVLNIRFVNGRLVLETPMRDGQSLPYLDVSVLGSTNLVDWTLPTAPASDVSGKPGNRDWYEPQQVPPSAFFRLKANLK